MREIKLNLGDCIEKLKELEDNSIDCIATDPPYGLEFMGLDWDKNFDNRVEEHEGKQWASGEDYRQIKEEGIRLYVGKGLSKYKAGIDFQKWVTEWGKECFRVLKPGGLIFCLGHTTTFHRLACGIEDAGFIICDMIEWIYYNGFTKAYDISKGFDKKACIEELKEKLGRKPTKEEFKEAWEQFRKIIGNYEHPERKGRSYQTKTNIFSGDRKEDKIEEKLKITEPKTELAKQWNGWKNARGLKPAHEPICMAQKPIEKSICENVETHGVGGINVDATRIPYKNNNDKENCNFKNQPNSDHFGQAKEGGIFIANEIGRFPANLISLPKILGKNTKMVDLNRWVEKKFGFNYWKFAEIPKPAKKEKNQGIINTETKDKVVKYGIDRMNTQNKQKNRHPTIKPIDLFTYLFTLGCPPNGTVLDPFMGSGTSIIAGLRLHLKCIGIEKHEPYLKIAKQRIKYYLKKNPKPLEEFI